MMQILHGLTDARGKIRWLHLVLLYIACIIMKDTCLLLLLHNDLLDQNNDLIYVSVEVERPWQLVPAGPITHM